MMGLILMAVLLLAGGAAQAASIVIPNSLETVEGNSSLVKPFGGVGSGANLRYQQVFSASGFSSLGGPHIITQIAFRSDASQGCCSFSSNSRRMTNPNNHLDISVAFS